MKTSYKMLISDWSSDVFSSDLTLSPSDVLAWFGDRQAITGTGALRHVAALWDSGQQERAREAARQYWVDADFDSREESAFHRHFKSLLRDEDELARQIGRASGRDRVWHYG